MFGKTHKETKVLESKNLSKNIKDSIIQKYKYTVQLIISGPDAVDIIRALINSKEIFNIDRANIYYQHGRTVVYQLDFCASGVMEVNIEGRVSYDIPYKATYNKKTHSPDLVFFDTRDKSSLTSTFKILAGSESLVQRIPQFAPTDTIIIIASHEDNNESSRIACALEEEASMCNILHCHVFLHPNRINGEVTWNASDVYCQISNTVNDKFYRFDPEDFAKSLRRELNEALNNHLNHLVQTVKKNVLIETVQEFKTILKKEVIANHHENEIKGECLVM